MKQIKYTLIVVIWSTLLACKGVETVANYEVIPLPQSIEQQQGRGFTLGKSTVIFYEAGNSKMERNAHFLSAYIQEALGYKLLIKRIEGGKPKNAIILTTNRLTQENVEGYIFAVNKEQVTVTGSTEAGVFYGIQTLRKSIPLQSLGKMVYLPAVNIKDAPRFGYRGMMLDVGRHFFSVSFVKEYIDLLALHNINNFHWHLTEDQGWRIEIKKYPKLTSIASQRKETVIGHNSGKYDGVPYGGFYTQEQIKEVVSYAAERYINVIPEIDAPGHMQAALTAYPRLGCTGGPYEVATSWGVFKEILCIGNDSTLQFMYDVLDEVLVLFPSKYIHIGGDESPRIRWMECSKCQARIKQLGIKADHRHSAEDCLQSYFTVEVEKYLNSRGRRLIGWDEILEGEIAPNAIVMSWRGTAGGVKAAQMNHDVIMSPNSYAYFDYYQAADTKNEPLSIGGLLPMERVYSMEPVDPSLTEAQKKHIIGAQANLWTEYIPNERQVEYQVLPRMSALCEVQWCQPEKKNFQDFCSRLPRLMAHYDSDSLNYATHIFDINTSYVPNFEKEGVEAILYTVDDAPIYYTLDGTEPTEQSMCYKEQLIIKGSVTLKAQAFRPSGMTRLIEQTFIFSKATMKKITLEHEPSSAYAFKGANTLIDGLQGEDGYTNGAWLGFVAHDLVATIDLGKETEFHKVSAQSITQMTAYIQSASAIEVEASDDNCTFRKVASMKFSTVADNSRRCVESHLVEFPVTKAHYVRVTVKRASPFPKGHSGAGSTPYLFVNEIAIN